MDTAISIALIGSATTLLTAAVSATVAVTIYRLGEKGRARGAALEQQRITVVRMLDTMDTAVRNRLSTSLLRGLRDPNTDVLLALPRLLLELPEEDLDVANWCAGQVQRALQIVRRKPFIERILNIEARLISWHRGDITTAWFTEALIREPYDSQFHVRKRTRFGTWLRDASETGALIGAVSILRRLWTYATS